MRIYFKKNYEDEALRHSSIQVGEKMKNQQKLSWHSK
jgi:hypothetical protein